MAHSIAARFDAFVSYDRRADTLLAQKITAALEQRGFRLWIDSQQLTVGEPFGQAIQDALDESRFVIAIVSRSTSDSTWIRREWKAALRLHDAPPHLVPIWVGDVTPPDELQGVPGLRVSPEDPLSVEAAVEALARRLRDAQPKAPMEEPGVEELRAASPSIPALDKWGFLPEGVHIAPAAEVIERFGRFTPRRESLGADLGALLRRAKRMGAESMVIGGSFVSDAPTPGDLDVVFVLESNPSMPTVASDAEAILAYVASGKSTFVATEGQSLETWLSFLSNAHLGSPRGVIRIPLGRGSE
jgi:hypothetical protein